MCLFHVINHFIYGFMGLRIEGLALFRELRKLEDG